MERRLLKYTAVHALADIVDHLTVLQIVALSVVPVLLGVLAAIAIMRRGRVIAANNYIRSQTPTDKISRKHRRLATGSTPPPLSPSVVAFPRPPTPTSKRKSGLRPSHARR